MDNLKAECVRAERLLASHASSWIEIENDSAVFTLAVEDLGVRGLEVTEVFDLDAAIKGRVYGVIVTKEVELTEKPTCSNAAVNSNNCASGKEADLKQPYFIKQTIDNSCATNAILNIVMNIDPRNAPGFQLGGVMQDFYDATKNLLPMERGDAVKSCPAIALAHHRHVRYSDICDGIDVALMEVRRKVQKKAVTKYFQDENEAKQSRYHFSAYLPFAGHMFELNSLHDRPIDYGLVDEKTWTTRCFDTVRSHDMKGLTVLIVGENERYRLENLLRELRTKRETVEVNVLNESLEEADSFSLHIETSDGKLLHQMHKSPRNINNKEEVEYGYETEDLCGLDAQIKEVEEQLEESKRQYVDVLRKDDRMTHNYFPFFIRLFTEAKQRDLLMEKSKPKKRQKKN